LYHFFVIHITNMESFSTLVLSLPTRNSTVRMRMWRALKDSGCGVLRDGVYVLPAGAAHAATLTKIGDSIRAAGGFAMTAALSPAGEAQLAQVRALFDRSAAYAALVADTKDARAALRRLGPRRSQTRIERLQRQFDRLAAIDFFPGRARDQATEALAALRGEFRQANSRSEPRASRRALRPQARAAFQNRVWATRAKPWVDRLASGWLIKRFIDPAARFTWLDRPSSLPKGAVGFDFDGARFTHVRDRVTFEVLLESFGLEKDPALAAIGACVHFLDVGGIPVSDAKGLETVLRGVREKARGDDALLAEAMRIFDHFYSANADSKPAKS
jgi:hypothetical protein